jgi:hypothetical protein
MRIFVPFATTLVALLLLPGIARAADPVPSPPEDPALKFPFTRETGCQNDGSVEFCVAKADLALQAKVRRIAPSVRTGTSRGRVGCEPKREILYFFPTPGHDPAVCSGRHGALTERAWGQLLELAALSGISRFAQTRYE